MTTLTRLFQTRRADLAMGAIVTIWGCNIVVMKNGLDTVAPVTYNALRFLVGLPLILAFALHNRALLRVSRRDLARLVIVNAFGSVLNQVVIVEGLKRTTSTNSALLGATNPVWITLFSVVVGLVAVRRRALIGIGITWIGVVLVILGRSGASLSMSHDDLIGSLLALASAIIGAIGTIYTMPLVRRLGSMKTAVWGYVITAVGLSALALPSLLTLDDGGALLHVAPHVLYGGLLASAGGFLAWNYALAAIGPARAATYHNFTPIIAACAGIMLLGEPLSVGLIAGGALTLVGVVIVRHNTFLRPPAPLASEAAPEPAPAR